MIIPHTQPKAGDNKSADFPAFSYSTGSNKKNKNSKKHSPILPYEVV